MSEENEEINLDNIEEVNLEKEVVNLNVKSDQKIDMLADGTEILRDELEDEEPEDEISDENLRKLVEFTTGEKNMTDEQLETLRNDEVELERLIKISMIKSKNFTYAPKKNFNTTYKKQRQRKNKQAKKSRAINRR